MEAWDEAGAPVPIQVRPLSVEVVKRRLSSSQRPVRRGLSEGLGDSPRCLARSIGAAMGPQLSEMPPFVSGVKATLLLYTKSVLAPGTALPAFKVQALEVRAVAQG